MTHKHKHTHTHTHTHTHSIATGRLRNVTAICTIKLILFYFRHVNAPVPNLSRTTVRYADRRQMSSRTGKHSVIYHLLEYHHL